MVQPTCFESGWCDYSEEHASIRSALEAVILGHREGKQSRLPVIVAPYGSGKTRLLEHLEWFAKRNSIPVLRVELALIASFIRERYGSLHESRLAQAIEEYFSAHTGSEWGVLLVDEVEEAYDQLARIVEYETSPFRGLADKVYRGETRVLPILAFGPSSMLKEAVFGPVAWRSLILQIPLVPPSIAARGLGEGLEGGARELLGNAVWWAAKGRPGWLPVARASLLDAFNALREGGGEAGYEKLYTSEQLSTEVVEGVPLLDRRGLRELERHTGSPGLAALLALHIGPVPFSLLEEYGVEKPLAGSPAYIVSRTGVRLEELLEKAERLVSRIARARGAGQQSVDRAVYSLRLAARAWSSGGIVAYDPHGLKELAVLAADLAREVYPGDPDSHVLLESLDLEVVGYTLERLPEPVVALRPSFIAKLYPLVSSTPLIGCARRVGAHQVVRLVEALELEELREYSRAVAEELGLGGEALVVPLSIAVERDAEIACKAAKGSVVVVAVPLGQEPAQLPGLEAAERLGKLRVAVVTGKPGLLLYSMLYNAATECSVALSSPEAHVERVYGSTVKVLVEKQGGKASLRDMVLEVEAGLAKLERGLGLPGEALAAITAFTVVNRGEGVVEEIAGLLGGAFKEHVEGLAEKARAVLEEISARHVPPCLLRELGEVAPLLSQIVSLVESQGSGEAYLGGVRDIVEAAKTSVEEAAGNLPREGIVAELYSLLDRMERVLELAESLARSKGYKCVACVAVFAEEYAKTLSRRVGEELGKLDEIVKQYRGLAEMASKLPDQAREAAEKALREALRDALVEASIEPLVDLSEPLTALLMYAGKAVEYEASVKKLVEEIIEILAPITGGAAEPSESLGAENGEAVLEA